jgi:Protein of unknown function (DUF4199)
MGRIILVYGSIAGVIVIAGWTLAMSLGADGGTGGMIAGYLSMLVAFSMIFAGVKRYRDTAQGGVIRFWPALGLGLAIACVASIFYLLSWEVYMAATDYRFMGEYIAQTLEAEKAKGTAPAEIAKMAAEMGEFEKSYANPLFRMAVTFSEIAPVGLLVALVSAALLRNSRFMPAVAAR